jgi:phenylalanyl-tRNA synthetase alpha chain
MLQTKIETLVNEAKEAFLRANSSQELYDLKVRYLGKQGALSEVMKGLAQVPKEERPSFGKMVNEKKGLMENAYQAREQELARLELAKKIESEKLDLSLPGPGRSEGSRHPISLIAQDVVSILSRLGYSVRTGPQIEEDWYNFEALNIPANHPSRDLQDTFYIDETHVLRTHTSPIQIRTMEKEKPPLKILAPGSVFRCDSDISHSPNFHQIEGLLIDHKVSMADLKGTIAYFIRELFGQSMKVRFRPSFFPFTEPSAEFDCSCPICKGKGCRMCKQSGWVEIGGCGLVNPKVLTAAKIDPSEWQGFAFGFGLERMAIIRYGIEDIRLFSENDLRFLGQFSL